MDAKNSPLPDYMAKSGERVQHPFLMYDNILATPDLLETCLRDCTDAVHKVALKIRERGITRIFLTGCGTSMFVGKQLVYALEQVAGIPGMAENAFELLTYPPVELNSKAALIVISHSGNTLVDRQIAEMAKEKGAYVVCITDNPSAAVLPYAEDAIVGPGGLDSAIPKTRSYTTSLFRGLMLVAELTKDNGPEFWNEIRRLPTLAHEILDQLEGKVKKLVDEWSTIDRYMAAGAGPNAWTSVEAALKMMEAVGFPANGFELEEATHGPELALSDRGGIIFFQSGKLGLTRALTASRAAHVAGAKVAVFTDLPEAGWSEGIYVFPIPAVHDMLSPVLMIIPAQLIVYYTALRLGLKPDMAGTNNPKIQDAILILHPAGSH